MENFACIVTESTLISDHQNFFSEKSSEILITNQLNAIYEKQLQIFFSEKSSEFLINWLTIWFRFSSEKDSEFWSNQFFRFFFHRIFLLKTTQKKIDNLHTSLYASASAIIKTIFWHVFLKTATIRKIRVLFCLAALTAKSSTAHDALLRLRHFISQIARPSYSLIASISVNSLIALS